MKRYIFKGKKYPLYKKNKKDKIYWVDFRGQYFGLHVFTFDGIKFYNMFEDYRENLTEEQKKIFDSENPFWAKFFDKDADETEWDGEDDEPDDWWLR